MEPNEVKSNGNLKILPSHDLRASRLQLARELLEDPLKFDEYANKQCLNLLYLATKILRDPEEAKDAVQEALMKIWKGLPGYKGNSSLDTWSYRIVANAALVTLRHRDKT